MLTQVHYLLSVIIAATRHCLCLLVSTALKNLILIFFIHKKSKLHKNFDTRSPKGWKIPDVLGIVNDLRTAGVDAAKSVTSFLTTGVPDFFDGVLKTASSIAKMQLGALSGQIRFQGKHNPDLFWFLLLHYTALGESGWHSDHQSHLQPLRPGIDSQASLVD